jgi:hypothetical protein
VLPLRLSAASEHRLFKECLYARDGGVKNNLNSDSTVLKKSVSSPDKTTNERALGLTKLTTKQIELN